MIFAKIRSRLRNRVTKRQLLEEFIAVRKELKAEREATASLGKALFERFSQTEAGIVKRFEGIEQNNMAMLENLDKWGTRLVDEIKNMQAVAFSDEDDKQPTEAQIKREWFGEDE